MSEHDLPSELASFEVRLRQQPLEASGIDRDALLYQAGWAAAEASRKTNWIWPVTSGVLAASVFVLAGLLVSSSEELPEGVFSNGETIAESSGSSDPPPEFPNNGPPYEGGGYDVPRWRWTSRSPFLVMRERALRMEFDEPAVVTWADDDTPIKTITARQLMQEMLGETS